MNRKDMLQRMQDDAGPFEMIIIGGGATGLGTAIEAASRGYRALLLEQHDFGKGTSSRSTKLIHGGLRYLRRGHFSFVLESLRERRLLLRNAPHLVQDLPFVVPSYAWWEAPFYGIGLKLYDLLAGRRGLGPSRHLSKEETIRRLPTIETRRLRGGVLYHDGQFDDARLLINMAQTAAEQGGTLLNYVKAVALTRAGDVIKGVVAHDLESGKEMALEARVVVNAAGPFSDSIRRMDDPEAEPLIQPSRGVHIVLDRSFLPGDSALMVPRTDDGRVLFAIPWHGRVIVGTTETPISSTPLEPKPQPEEIEFLLSHAARYLADPPGPGDVLSAFAGVRPLVRRRAGKQEADLSRGHVVRVSPSGLVTIAGGKWTTYRRMAEETVSRAAALAGLEERPSVTKGLHLHGHHEDASSFGDLGTYGSDAPALRAFLDEKSLYGNRLHPKLAYRAGEIIWAVRHEMARTIEDVLARRTRALFLDAGASMEMAPVVADLMAGELGRDAAWKREQVESFVKLARGYLPEGGAGP